MTRRVDDELVILDVSSGQYFGLNAVGASIWDRLEREATSEELVDMVVAEYDVARDQAAADVGALVRQLVDAGLVSMEA